MASPRRTVHASQLVAQLERLAVATAAQEQLHADAAQRAAEPHQAAKDTHTQPKEAHGE